MQGTQLRAVAAWTVLTLWGSSADAAPLYNLTGLGPWEPIGINNQGEVGLSSDPISYKGGFGTARDYFFNPPTAQVYESLGQAAGTLSAPTTQGPRPGGSTSPWVNDAGDFATTKAVDSRIQPYVSIGGVQTLIPMIDHGVMDPKAINASGQVVGEGFTKATDYGYHAFLFSGGEHHALGTLGGRSSGAEAINNQGIVVGWAMAASPIPNQDGEIHAFMYDGAMHDLSASLGAAYSHAYGINSSGAIVGDMSSGYYDAVGAFLLDAGKVTDLNSLLPPGSPWHLSSALAINDLGQIIGVGTYDGWARAFLLTPSALGNPPDVQAVPEPGLIAFAACVAAGFAIRKARRTA